MREILFRGKSVKGNYWAYGVPMKDGKKTYIVCSIDVLKDKFFYCEVIAETVSEYTGLKEWSGKCVFEGDIVRFDYVDDEGNDAHEDHLIIFENGAFRAQYLGNLKYAPISLDEIGIAEGYVVGNKWDNPELLEVKK